MPQQVAAGCIALLVTTPRDTPLNEDWHAAPCQAFTMARKWLPEAVEAAGTAATRGAWGFVPQSMALMVAGAAVCKLITQWVEDKGCAAVRAVVRLRPGFVMR